MPIFTRADLTLLYEACDVQREAYTDTLRHDDGDMDEVERRSMEQERDQYADLMARINPHI